METIEDLRRQLAQRKGWQHCQTHGEINADHAWGCPDCLAELRIEQGALAHVWRAFIAAVQDVGCWGMGELETEVLWEAATAGGLVETVPYDPEAHGAIEGADPGDRIWRLTALGRRLADVA